MKEVETFTTRRFTTSEQKGESSTVEHKSVIIDLANRNYCIIEREGAKVIERESNISVRWTKEAKWIGNTTPTMNRDKENADSVTCATAFSHTIY